MFLVSMSPKGDPTPRPLPDTPTRPALAGVRVAFCGPIGAIGRPAGGGYESANRRNCDALLRRGVVVAELPYPNVTQGSLAKLLRYGASFVRAAAFLVLRRRDYDLLHLTPLNMHFAVAESWLIACARRLGKPVLLDIRAGTFVRHYESGSALYRRTTCPSCANEPQRRCCIFRTTWMARPFCKRRWRKHSTRPSRCG